MRDIVQKTFDVIVDALEQGERVEIRNFGVFDSKVRKAKKGRNPKTGQEFPVPERKVVTFKAGLDMKEKVKATID